MRKLGASVAGAAGTIAVLTLLSRIVGFVRVWAQNGALGDQQAGSAFSTANTVPNVLFEVAAGGALAGAVIPLISGFLAKNMGKELRQTASALLTWICTIGFGVAFIVFFTAHPIMHFLLGAQASDAEVELGTRLLRIFAFQVPLYGMSVVLTGVLQAHKRFLLPALAPMLSSFVVLATFGLFAWLAEGHQNAPALLSDSAVYVLGWGTTFGVVVFSLPQLIPVMRLTRIRPTFTFPEGVGRRVIKLAGAGLGGLLAQQVYIVTAMLFANSHGGTGAYPIFTFANAVYMLPYAVLAVPIATAVFPRLSEAAALPERPDLEMLTARSTRLVMESGIICVGLLIVMAAPAQVVFNLLRPAPSMDIAMIAMAPGLVGFSLIYHCSRVLYAVEASRAVFVTNSVAWLSVVAGFGVAALMGVSGRTPVLIAIGIAMSIGMTIGAVGEIFAIRSAVGKGAMSGIAKAALILVVSTVIFSAIAFVLVRFILASMSLVWGLVCSVLCGAVIVLGAGFATVWLFDRSALQLTQKSA